MRLTDTARRQHAKLLEIIHQFMPLLRANGVVVNAGRARDILSQLDGLLRVHLRMKDSVLYPFLHQHKNSAVRSLSLQCSRELGGLQEAFDAYVANWPTPQTIEANCAQFIQESIAILSRIAHRIEVEDDTLFPLVDAAERVSA